MKRILMRALLVIGVVILVLLSPVIYGFARTSAIKDGFVISDFVHIVKDGMVGVSVVDVGGGKVALIDAGNDPTGKALLAGLTKLNVKPENVLAIFLTHGHPDHLGGVHLFPSAQVYAMEQDIPLAEGRAKSHGFLTRFMPIKPTGVKITQALHDTDMIKVGNRTFLCMLIPGHTAGSAAYWVDGVLFVGDSADASRKGVVLPAQWLFSDSPKQNRASLVGLDERLNERPVGIEYIVPAHSGVIRDPRALDKYAGRPDASQPPQNFGPTNFQAAKPKT